MKHFTYKIIAVLLALVTLVAAVPSAAFAVEVEEQTESTGGENSTGGITTRETPEYLEMDDGYISVMVSTKNGGFHPWSRGRW